MHTMERQGRRAGNGPASIPLRAALTPAFVASGAAGLIFEMVWFYRSGLVLGNSVWAASIVLSSFMAGLALGNILVGWQWPRIKRPLRAYAVLEIVVAVSGVALTYVLPGLTGLVARLAPLIGDSPWLLAAARLTIAFGALVVPATAMGATLPALVGAVWRAGDRLGRPFGHLYGWNTLGAVGGVIGAEVFLIDAFGVTGAAWVAALLNLIAAAIALWMSGRTSATDVRDNRLATMPTRLSGSAWRLLGCALLSGGTFLALEVIWFRFLSMYVLTTTLSMSLMLAVVLAGIGAGGLVASRSLNRSASLVFGLPGLAFLASCMVAVCYRMFDVLTTGIQIAEWHHVLWCTVVLTGPTSFMSGVLLAALAESLHQDTVAGARTAAWLLLANTAGAMCGPLLAAFVLLPVLGMERAFFALSAIYAAVGLLAMRRSNRTAPSRTASARSWTFRLAGAAMVLGLVTFPFGLMDLYHARVARAYAADGSEIVATREGPTETILLMQQRWLNQPVYNRLVTNGFSMSGTAVPGRRYMRYFAYWPMMLHEAPLRRALVICYGVGVTAGAVTDISSLDLIDVVEISKDVVAVSDLIYSPTRHPLRDPRVRVHLDDGRYFLQTSTERYDLITGEPPPPRTPGAVNIYTREYFRLIYDRLAEGGIATYWVPVARPDPGTDVNTIIRAFCDVFDDCSLWNATPFDFMLVGARQSTGPVSEAHFTRGWRVPALEASLREIGFEMPEQIGATFLGDAPYLRELMAATPPLTDVFPQRLRPDPTRPSLSDPRYGRDAAVVELYQSVIEPARAREAFARSNLIRRLWPPDLIERTLPFFQVQQVLNRVLWEGGQPLRQIEDLHFLLTKTALKTAPLWLLGSDDVRQSIVERASETGGAVEYARGLHALADRDYSGAVSRFERAEALSLQGPTLRPLLVYALCLDGRIDAARALARGIRPANPDDRHFWSWMGLEFNVGPLSGGPGR
jgi:predicted membrane-bound spermidine synthase